MSIVYLFLTLTALTAVVSFHNLLPALFVPRQPQSFRIMGGNAFPSTVRLNREQMLLITSLVVTDLTSRGVAVSSPVEMMEKETFGDVDFNIGWPHEIQGHEIEIFKSDICSRVMEVLECSSRVTNGDVTSLLTKDSFQVDLSFMNELELPMCTSAHANGDFCWILQLSLQRVGLLLTHQGLFIRNSYMWPKLSKKGISFFLSNDPARIADCIHLPREFFDGQTPHSTQALFEAVVATRFFDESAYAAEAKKTNMIAKKREKRRPMLANFVSWLKDRADAEGRAHLVGGEHGDGVEAPVCEGEGANVKDTGKGGKKRGGGGGGGEEEEEGGEDVSTLSAAVHAERLQRSMEVCDEVALYWDKLDAWTEHRLRICRIEREAHLKLLCKDFMNGSIVMAVCPNLKGPEVGEVLLGLRVRHAEGDWEKFHAFLLATDKERLEECVEEVALEVKMGILPPVPTVVAAAGGDGGGSGSGGGSGGDAGTL